MKISPRESAFLHKKLPIDANEQILGVYRHHWFIYVVSWSVGLAVSLLVISASVALTILGGGPDSGIAGYETLILVAGILFGLLILAGSFIPVYLRAKEQLVLTEESLLQVLEPSLFANKVDQLGLQHIADVTVRQDLFGLMFGYGGITIETPGEQDNFVFVVVPHADKVAREIMAAHENYVVALQGGYMSSTLGSPRNGGQVPGQQPEIDPEQYRQFLEYQRMVARQRQEEAGGSPVQPNDPNGPNQNGPFQQK